MDTAALMLEHKRLEDDLFEKLNNVQFEHALIALHLDSSHLIGRFLLYTLAKGRLTRDRLIYADGHHHEHVMLIIDDILRYAVENELDLEYILETYECHPKNIYTAFTNIIAKCSVKVITEAVKYITQKMVRCNDVRTEVDEAVSIVAAFRSVEDALRTVTIMLELYPGTLVTSYLCNFSTADYREDMARLLCKLDVTKEFDYNNCKIQYSDEGLGRERWDMLHKDDV